MRFFKVIFTCWWSLMMFLPTAQAMPSDAARHVDKIRLSWEIVPDAVWYKLIVTHDGATGKEAAVLTKEKINTNGYELHTADLPFSYDKLVWQVAAVDYQGNVISDFTKPKKLTVGEINPTSPRLTSESEKLPYAKNYPVYSWVPVAGAASYEVQIFYVQPEQPWETSWAIKTLTAVGGDEHSLYDTDGFIDEGTYGWRVRAKDQQGLPLGDWSPLKQFTIDDKDVTIAALGDSITHGGGAVNGPPSFVMYDWQTYTGLSILNLGYSGDTTKQLNQRFKKDVLSFAPKILVIMGGINDIRLGALATEVIIELKRLKFRCQLYGITPVFVTITPLNPEAMRTVINLPPSPGWQVQREKVNAWIETQPYFVDAGNKLATPTGMYLPGLSTDGLHPDVAGKAIIGQAIGDYLREKFPVETR